MKHPNDSFKYWSTFSQHLVNTVEKVYHTGTSKWTYFYIQFAHPNYICFDFDEKDELVVIEHRRKIYTEANLPAFVAVNWGQSTSNPLQDQYHPWDVHVTAIS